MIPRARSSRRASPPRPHTGRSRSSRPAASCTRRTTADVTLKVHPVAVNDEYTAVARRTFPLPGQLAPSVLANDLGVSLTAALVSGPATGTLSFRSDGTFAYVAPPDILTGTATF